MADTQDFTVSLSGVRLTAAQKTNLNRAIQKAALAELANFRFGPNIGVHIPNKEWLGIWIGPLRGKLADLAKTIGPR